MLDGRQLLFVCAALAVVVDAVVPGATHIAPGNDGQHTHDYHDGTEPPTDYPCYSIDDCPLVSRCFDVACGSSVAGATQGGGVCTYTRLPVQECCLSSAECCSFAGPHQIGVCDKNCTCINVPAGRQCVEDADCDATLQGLLCRSRGECSFPVCAAGWCECVNTTGLDLDQDGVACPDDCDDTDAHVTRTVTCARDADNDHYADCSPDYYEEAPAGDDAPPRKRPNCATFCVGANETCPYGWTDPSDAMRFEKRRAHDVEMTPCEQVPWIDECDCCDRDPRAFPGSLYVSDRPNMCHDADYNCDGNSTTFACCVDGQNDTHTTHRHSMRTLWHESACVELESDECGGCASSGGKSGGGATLNVGWACSQDCDNYDTSVGGVARRKRDVSEAQGGGKSGGGGGDEDDCPASCNGECVCVDGQTPPMLGECAKVVTSCLEVRPDVFGDAEECCAVAVQ